MEKQLPKNWIKTSIVDFAELVKTKGEENIIPYLEIGDVNTYNKVYELKEKPSVKGCKISKKNDLLISKVRPTRGAITITKHEGLSVSSAFTILRFKELTTSKLVFYQLAYNKNFYDYLGDNCTGTMYPTVSEEIIKKYSLIIPPLPEQNRIVAKLDALFTQLETIKTSMDKVPELLKDFRQQVLTQAVTGKLTEEWRKGEKLKGWEGVLLNDICISITDGDHQAPPQVEIGIPFLVISNLSKGYFEFDKVSRFVPKEYYDSLKDNRKPKAGDVLYTVTGSYGIPLLVDFEKEFCFQRHIAILRPNNEKIISKFLKYLLQSNLILSQAHNVATGTAQLTVPLGGIKKFEVSLPTIIEQQEIVSRVESLFAKTDAIEKQYESLKAKIDNLPQALLHKAFKGELTEQLESDGDARELLKEIQELKAKTGKAVKGKSVKVAAKKLKEYGKNEEVLRVVAEE